MSSTASEINVSDRAQEFAEEVNQAALSADNEEELRINMEAAIRRLASDLDMDVDPENERTVLSGRPDAVYGDMIIEYKNPNRSDNWVEEAFGGRDENDSGLIDYMYDIAKERAHNEEEQEAILDKMVGVGTNGHKIFFCRYRPHERVETVASGQTPLLGLSREDVKAGVEIIDVYDIQEGARTFLTFLRSLSRKPLTSEKLAELYGPDGEIAQETVQELYDELTDALDGNPRVSTLYDEWERVFGIVYGEEIEQISDDRQLFGNIYGLKEPEVRPLLFTVHTYYGLLMKMLSTELLSTVRDTPIEEAGLYEPNDEDLKRKLSQMESGEQFEEAGLQDFFEEGFFSWYLDIWNPTLAEQVRKMAEELTSFEPATPSIKHEVVRDILKDLYEELVPQVVRHDLGEYLTPDWLAEYVIGLSEYEQGQRILDPACGSGTFLVEAIDTVRKESNKEGEELLNEILENVVGFDLNPISVIASRTNYLMSLGEFAFHSTDVRIPVYQCDSILTPSKYIDVTSGGETYQIKTREGTFRIPSLEGQSSVEKLLSKADDYLEIGVKPGEFVENAVEEFSLSSNWECMLDEFYAKLYNLEQEDRDGVWTSLLRNRLAPAFIDDVDLIVGNPPYIYWENLSEDYRSNTEDLWEKYKLSEFSDYRGDAARKDVSTLMSYTVMDEYLSDEGELSFLIPRSLFKSHSGGHGFRRFSIPQPNDSDIPLKVLEVDDLSRFNPFENVSNQTAVMHIQKGSQTEFPVPYRIWNKTGNISPEDSLSEVKNNIEITELVGEPVQEDDPQSEWLTLEPKAIEALRQVLGESEYTAREGVNTIGADGIYHIEILEEKSNKIEIENVPTEGRKKSIRERGSVNETIERDLIYPSIKGRHIERWGRDGSLHLLLPHKNERGPHNAISEPELRTNFIDTYTFLQSWEDILLEDRPLDNFAYYDEDVDPFYFLGNVGEYTFAPYKLAWREISDGVQATVLEPSDDGLGEQKPIVNTHKVMFIPFSTRKAAHFACAIMNSSFTELAIKGYTSALTGLSPHILETINIPEYKESNDLHERLANLSIEAHQDERDVGTIEKEIDEKVANLYDTSEEGLEDIQQSLEEL